MKRMIWVLLAVLLLAGCGKTAAGGTVEIDGIAYEKNAAAITLPQGTSLEHYEAVKAALPNCEITFEVPFQGGYLSQDIESITLSSLTEEEAALLDCFPNLKTVDASGLDTAVAAKLQQDHPQWQVSYLVTVGGESYSPDTREITLEGVDTAQLENLVYLPNLESVHISDPQGDPEILKALAGECPITWEKEAFGKRYSSDITELDLSQEGLTFDDAEAMEAELAWFPNLDRVFFGDVEVDNDTMAAYRERQAENYKVVWNIVLNYRITMPSDAEYFMPRKFYMTVVDTDLVNLKYFNDMVTVDLGHMYITHCEWLAGMPKLQYLILADTPVQSIEPVANCKELLFFEIFDTPIKDFSPLVECKKLRDLNMCWTDGDPEQVAQLTWLERFWWWGRLTLPELTEEEKSMIVNAMPNCEVVFQTTTSTGSGWRKGELYFKMRDNLGMEYMD